MARVKMLFATLITFAFKTLPALLLSPFAKLTVVFTGLTTVAAFLNNPLIRVLLYVAVVLGAYVGGDVRGRIIEHRHMVAHEQMVTAQLKKEAADAVAKADAARAAAVKKFNRGGFNPRHSIVPGRVRRGSDGWARD